MAELLERYPRAVVHLRGQYRGIEPGTENQDTPDRVRKLCMVFGAGIGRDLGFPDWNALIDKIAETDEIDGRQVIQTTKTADPQGARVQLLYEHFRTKVYEEVEPTKHFTSTTERELWRRWQDIVRRELYKDVAAGNNPAAQHPYLTEFLEIIKTSPLTINFNFDDTLERMVLASRSPEEENAGRGYETVWDAAIQWRRSKGVIYHPNGFLPINPMEPASESLAFSERAFADQLIRGMAGHYSSVLHFLGRYTCLFIGLSLEDQTLKHLLRQSATLNPGHAHYHVAYLSEPDEIPEARRRAISHANFELYNLVTLFLTSDEIGDLAKLIHRPEQEFCNAAEELGVATKYCFYLTGAVGVGKSTAVRHFRTVESHDEWFEERHELLGKRSDELDDDERAVVDAWIARQFRLKNNALEWSNEGIHVVDRCPLDPLAFTETEQDWPSRALSLRDEIAPGRAQKRVESGAVVLLKGDSQVMANRNLIRNRSTNPEYLGEQQDKLEKIYSPLGAHVLDVREQTVDEVVRRVGRVIHLDDYSPLELAEFLDRLAEQAPDKKAESAGSDA